MRLDEYLTEKNFFDSRTKAKQSILRGEIFINGHSITRPAYQVDVDKEYDVKRICENSFVSLGGFKLKKAIDDFKFNAQGLIVADIGASTGGFTDCLLQEGAKKIYAVDLNDCLLHDKLKNDNRVINVIKNARNLQKSDFIDNLDLIVADLSFISAAYVLDVFSNLLDDNKQLILLIKPQFETGERKKYKNGIIRDIKMQKEVCANIYDLAIQCNLYPQAFTNAPKTEGKNLEFLMLFTKNSQAKITKEQIYSLF